MTFRYHYENRKYVFALFGDKYESEKIATKIVLAFAIQLLEDL